MLSLFLYFLRNIKRFKQNIFVKLGHLVVYFNFIVSFILFSFYQLIDPLHLVKSIWYLNPSIIFIYCYSLIQKAIPKFLNVLSHILYFFIKLSLVLINDYCMLELKLIFRYNCFILIKGNQTVQIKINNEVSISLNKSLFHWIWNKVKLAEMTIIWIL